MSASSVIDREHEFAREAMNSIWGICQKLHNRRISIFDAIRECMEECERYYNNIKYEGIINGKEEETTL